MIGIPGQGGRNYDQQHTATLGAHLSIKSEGGNSNERALICSVVGVSNNKKGNREVPLPGGNRGKSVTNEILTV